MSNEFNLERAKAGQPVEFRRAATSTWEPVYFVGLSNSGAPVIEMYECADVFKVNVGLLRMAPKKVKVRYRNYMLSDSVHSSVSVLIDSRSLESPQEIEKKSWFRGWIHTDWQEAEITE